MPTPRSLRSFAQPAALALTASIAACQSGMLPASPGSTTLGQDDLARLAAAAQLPAQGAPDVAAGGQPGQTGGLVTGSVHLAPSIASKLRAGDTVFVMARDAQSNKIVAVSRFMAAHPNGWPMPFELADARLAAGQSVHLSVRIDKDGDASTKQAGDLTGERTQAATVPSSGADVEVNQVLPESAVIQPIVPIQATPR